MTPNYMQAAGLARALGATVQPWPLRETGAGDDCALGAGSRRVAPARLPQDAGDPALQSEQPDRRAADRRGARRDLPHRRHRRRLGDRRRDLSRRRAGRGRHADGVGPLRARHRLERSVEGVWSARAAHRLGRRAARARQRPLGDPRLHDDRAGRHQRSARAHRARTGAARDAAGADARHHPRRTIRSSAAGSIGRTG